MWRVLRKNKISNFKNKMLGWQKLKDYIKNLSRRNEILYIQCFLSFLPFFPFLSFYTLSTGASIYPEPYDLNS